MDRPMTATNFAVHEIKRLIVERKLPPGEKIDQASLAERLHLSRLPVRQALTHLAGQNFIQLRDHKSAIVMPVSGADMRDLYDLRCQMERWGLGQRFQSYSDAHVEDLKKILGDTEKCIASGDHPAFLVMNRKFHFSLYSIIENKYTLRSIMNLFDLSERYHWMCTSAPGMMEVSHSEHQQIIDWIEKKDLEGFLSGSEKHNRKTIEWVKSHGMIDVSQ